MWVLPLCARSCGCMYEGFGGPLCDQVLDHTCPNQASVAGVVSPSNRGPCKGVVVHYQRHSPSHVAVVLNLRLLGSSACTVLAVLGAWRLLPRVRGTSTMPA